MIPAQPELQNKNIDSISAKLLASDVV